jgi:hypothetical protein
LADGFAIDSTHGAYICTDQEDNPFGAGGGDDIFLLIN